MFIVLCYRTNRRWCNSNLYIALMGKFLLVSNEWHLAILRSYNNAVLFGVLDLITFPVQTRKCPFYRKSSPRRLRNPTVTGQLWKTVTENGIKSKIQTHFFWTEHASEWIECVHGLVYSTPGHDTNTKCYLVVMWCWMILVRSSHHTIQKCNRKWFPCDCSYKTRSSNTFQVRICPQHRSSLTHSTHRYTNSCNQWSYYYKFRCWRMDSPCIR